MSPDSPTSQIKGDDTSSQTYVSPPQHHIIHANDHGSWPFIGLLLLEVLLIGMVGSGLYFLQQKTNNEFSSNLSDLTNKTTSIQKESQQAIDAYKKNGSLGSATISQDLTLQTLKVNGKTTLNSVSATNIQATSITASTINGVPFPGNYTTTTATASSGIGSQFNGPYVAYLGKLNGLISVGNSGKGSTPTLSIAYGASGGTSVQGNTQITIAAGDGLTGGGVITLGSGGSASLNVAYGDGASNAVRGSTQLTCPTGSAGGNLSGGGNTITLGDGGSCGSLAVISNPFFGGTITGTADTTGLALSGAPLASGGNTSLLQVGLPISGGDTSVDGGTYIGINEPSNGNPGSNADFINLENNGSERFRVDSSGDLTLAGTATFQNTVNSSSAFKIQASGLGGSVVFDADTLNGRVGIGTSSPGNYTLDVGGSGSGTIEAATALYIGGSQVCTSSGCIGAGGGSSPASIHNTSSVQTAANFFIQSASASSPTAQIEALSGQTDNLFQTVASDGSTILDFIDPNGVLSVQSAIINGSLTVNGHLISSNSSGTTTVAAGSVSYTGSGATATLSGNDSAGTITLTTGTATGSLNAGDLADVFFAAQYKNSTNVGVAPHVVISPEDPTAASLGYYQQPNGAGNGFSLYTRTAPSTSTTYVFDYIVEQ